MTFPIWWNNANIILCKKECKLYKEAGSGSVEIFKRLQKKMGNILNILTNSPLFTCEKGWNKRFGAEIFADVEKTATWECCFAIFRFVSVKNRGKKREKKINFQK